MTIAAIFLALVVGALLIIFSTPEVIESLKYFFTYPWDFFKFAGQAVWDGYSALVRGSVGSWSAIETTLERAAPLICAGLGVSLAFRAGMFNIGAQGQMLLGAILAGYIGFHYDLPPGLHLLLALAGALIAGGLWGAIAGALKAYTGAHEVISTIMLNYVARFLLLWLLAKDAFQRPGSDNLLSPPVNDSATFPEIAGVHTGVLLAFVAAAGVWWLLDRSTLGFELRAVGANPDAARTAGMNVKKVYILAMAVAGVLAGLAAAMQILGHHDPLNESIAGTVGFDAITVALLGRATPLGTVLAGLLFGALSAGGLAMQGSAGIPPEIAQVLQALIVLFVAAPALVRGVLRMRAAADSGAVMAKGWGG
ncbi:MAG: ABC transporter permease [Nocardioidaceae bacterium]|nr:MAG: ABC transporter permease [Nocardioidaceae bacterium]